MDSQIDLIMSIDLALQRHSQIRYLSYYLSIFQEELKSLRGVSVLEYF